MICSAWVPMAAPRVERQGVNARVSSSLGLGDKGKNKNHHQGGGNKLFLVFHLEIRERAWTNAGRADTWEPPVRGESDQLPTWLGVKPGSGSEGHGHTKAFSRQWGLGRWTWQTCSGGSAEPQLWTVPARAAPPTLTPVSGHLG